MDPGTGPARADLVSIYSAAIDAVDPAGIVHARIVADPTGGRLRLRDDRWISWQGPLCVVGAGKAAAKMAAGCESALKHRGVSGLVIVPDGCGAELSRIEAVFAGHPVPDERGAGATIRLCDLLRGTDAGPILCLISGGASSLLEWPRSPVTLPEMMETTRLLLASGCNIDEANTVRKHLSEVKGGGLLRVCSARPLITLLLSDVIGDSPETIGSGPCVPDSTTFAEAEGILTRFGLIARVPDSVRCVLADGVAGKVRESVKPGDMEAVGVDAQVIGSNRDALAGAARQAERLGYRPVVLEAPLCGDTGAAALEWLVAVQRSMDRGGERPVCFIAGGETTVQVRGNGRGGRNCEFALALAERLAASDIIVLSAGTDGVDGPTDAAGAFVGPDTVLRARHRGLNSRRMLAENDSYTFFQELGDLFRPGPTGTNVMDLKLAVAHGHPMAED